MTNHPSEDFDEMSFYAMSSVGEPAVQSPALRDYIVSKIESGQTPPQLTGVIRQIAEARKAQ